MVTCKEVQYFALIKALKLILDQFWCQVSFKFASHGFLEVLLNSTWRHFYNNLLVSATLDDVIKLDQSIVRRLVANKSDDIM